MATTKTGRVLQSWVSAEFLDQVRERAQIERRPVSELVRIAVEDRLQTSPIGEVRQSAGLACPPPNRRTLQPGRGTDMDWEIRLPIGNREDPISNLGCDAGYLDNEDDVAVARQLFWDAIKGGLETVGEYVDHLESLPEADRRAVLDKARMGAGLEPTGVIEQRRSDFLFEAEARRLEPPGPPRWNPLQRCPECGTFPGEGGSWKPVTCERWWCDAHKHLAAEGDLEEHEEPYIGFNHNGTPIPFAKQRKRIEAWHRKQREEEERVRQQREEHERREYEAIEEAKQRYIDEGEISILGVRTRPDGRIIER